MIFLIYTYRYHQNHYYQSANNRYNKYKHQHQHPDSETDISLHSEDMSLHSKDGHNANFLKNNNKKTHKQVLLSVLRTKVDKHVMQVLLDMQLLQFGTLQL